jgi:hypothetical protein
MDRPCPDGMKTDYYQDPQWRDIGQPALIPGNESTRRLLQKFIKSPLSTPLNSTSSPFTNIRTALFSCK